MDVTKMKTRRQYRSERRWAPEHFPAGTLVEIEDSRTLSCTIERNGGSRVFEVIGTFKNGARSWVVETTLLDDERVFGPNSHVSFNFSWIERIVRRGSGPLVDLTIRGQRRDPLDVYDENGWATQALKAAIQNQHSKSYKNRYVFYSWETLVLAHLVEDIVGSRNLGICYGSLLEDLRRHHPEWFSSYVYDSYTPNCEVFSPPKEKFKRWVKQNYNRFRVSLDKREADEREVDRQEYERLCMEDLYDDLDRSTEDPVTNKKVIEDEQISYSVFDDDRSEW